MRVIDENIEIKESETTFKHIALSRRKSEDKKTPKTFKEIFGDLSDSVFNGDLDLSELNLSSLEGCPKKISTGNFSIEVNPNLESLRYFPTEFKDINQIYLDFSLFKKLDTLNNSVKDNIAHNALYITVSIDSATTEESEIITHMLIINNFATAHTNVRLIDLQYNILKVNQEKVRQQKRIYAKLNYSTEKFIRAISLL